MITSRDLNAELNVLEDKVKKGEVSNADVVKAVVLIAKLVRDIRTNQALGLRNAGVELRKPSPRREEDGKKK